MNIIKGFALNRNFYDNTPGVVAEIGELSTMGFTFSKEPRVYSSTSYATISLVHFPTSNSGVGTTAPIPDAQKEHILKVIALVYQLAVNAGGVLPPGAYAEYLVNQMGGEIADIVTGGVFVGGGRSIIEWVEWRNPAVPEANTNKVWFTNASFVGQFDEGEIEVVTPFDPADLFFGQPSEVKALLTSLTYFEEVERIQAARGTSSETKIWGNTYDYVNPVNRADKTPAKFTALLYGSAMDNVDVIKEAIVQHLLKNSNYTRDQWKNILPDLFLRSEFMIVPCWDKIAIENVVGSTNGVFSPIVDLEIDQNTIVNAGLYAGYTEWHCRAYSQALPYPFMSITLLAIGHIENRNEVYKLSQMYPDYFFTNNSSMDFDRMSKNTQEWVLMMSELIMAARFITTTSTVPQGYSRVIRGNRIYLVKNHKQMQYLVASPVILNV